MSGWWHRNRWGALTLVPLVGLALALPAHDMYSPFWAHAPHAPAASGDGGWVAYGGASMRLAKLTPATDLVDFGGTPVVVPKSVGVWRAEIEFRSARPDDLGGCTLTMEDSTGATYGANASELNDLGADTNYASCTPDTDLTASPAPSGGGGQTSWTSVVYFVAPAAAVPAAVRIVLGTKLPKYARLTPR